MMDKIQKLKSFKFPILFQLQCFHFRFLCVVKKVSIFLLWYILDFAINTL